MTALRGIKVLDLTRLLPGPFATLVLADLGAQVDKLEDAAGGDYLRHTPPHAADGQSVGYHALNRGKRSFVLDLKRPEGVATFKQLVPHYDVVFEQFRPGVLDRLGLGHDVLLELNPKLVICALTGYGQTGPLRDRAGHDLNYMARAGLLGLMGPTDGPPQLPSFQLADVSGGLWALVGILAALRERELTGKGKVIDIAMADSVLPFSTIQLARLFGGEQPERGNEILTGGIAPYQCYRTKDDGFVTLGSLEPKFLTTFARATGLDVDMSALFPGSHQAALKARFAEVFASRTRAEWEAFNLEHDCCVEPVLGPEELLTDPQLQARGVFTKTEVAGQPIVQYRTPVTPREVEAAPGPAQGAHTEEILREAGLAPARIQELREAGVAR